MPHGIVTRWNEDRGFGFIKPDDGKVDVFVHVTRITSSGVDALSVGDRVSFDEGTDVRSGKPEAQNVRII